MARWLTVFMAVAISGCANFTLEEAKTQQNTVNIQTSSEAAYRKLTDAAKERCYTLQVEAQYYPEAREGVISLVTRSDTLRFTWVKFEVKPAGADATITTTYRMDFPKFSNAAAAWSRDSSAPCPY